MSAFFIILGERSVLMTNSVAICVLTLCSLSVLKAADDITRDLYFLSGTPGAKRTIPVESTLYRFNRATKSMVVVRQVVDANVGTDFIESSQGRRVIVLGSPALQVSKVAVVDMNAPQVERTVPVEVSYTTELTVMRSYLLDIPTKGLYLALCLGTPDLKVRFLGVRLEAPAVQGPSLETIAFENLQYLRTDGMYGGGEGGRAVAVRGSANGGLIGDIDSGQRVPLGLRLPARVKPQLEEDLRLFVNTKEIAVLGRGYSVDNRPIEPGVMYVLNKCQQTWQAVKIPGAIPWVRSFGSWLAGIAAEPNRESARESPGKSQRTVAILKKSRLDLTVDHVYQSSGMYFPGELFLYNSVTSRIYDIRTEQGDSEVLLVTDDLAYYRVNDTLYKVAIGPAGLKEPVRLLTSEYLSGIHWAFLGPVSTSRPQ